MRVKPAPGRAVRDPRTMTLLPEDGRDVNERDPFWARRLRDEDVVGADEPEPEPEPEPEENPEQQPAAYAAQREA
jgi:Protein of unknown function (DUF2635)